MRNTFAKWQFKDRDDSPKRKAKIYCNKLPQDFFGHRVYAASEHKQRGYLREDIKTQRVHRKPTVMIERTS